jgi:hypothetical protein
MLREAATQAHLNSVESEHHHHSDHRHEPKQGSHSHEHRHSPGEPVHEHFQLDPLFLAALGGSPTLSPQNAFTGVVLGVPVKVSLPALLEVPSTARLSSLFRPPIA